MMIKGNKNCILLKYEHLKRLNSTQIVKKTINLVTLYTVHLPGAPGDVQARVREKLESFWQVSSN